MIEILIFNMLQCEVETITETLAEMEKSALRRLDVREVRLLSSTEHRFLFCSIIVSTSTTSAWIEIKFNQSRCTADRQQTSNASVKILYFM